MVYPWGHARDHLVMNMYLWYYLILLLIAIFGGYLIYLAAKRALESWREKHAKIKIEREAGLLFKRGGAYDTMRSSWAKLSRKELIQLVFEFLYLGLSNYAYNITGTMEIFTDDLLHPIEHLAEKAWDDIRAGKKKEKVKQEVLNELNKLSEEGAKID